jgi:hypothetical protein
LEPITRLATVIAVIQVVHCDTTNQSFIRIWVPVLNGQNKKPPLPTRTRAL